MQNEFQVKIPDFMKKFLLSHVDVDLAVFYRKENGHVVHDIGLKAKGNKVVFYLDENELQCMELERLKAWYKTVNDTQIEVRK